MRGIFKYPILILVILFCTLFAADKNYYLPDLLQAADKNNPEIKAEEGLLRKYAEEVRLAQLGWIPDFSLGHGVYLDNVDRPNYTSFSVGLSRLFGQTARVQSAKETYELQKYVIERVRARIYTEISNTYQNYVQHQKRLAILNRSYQSALGTLSTVKESFANGNLTPDRVITSQEIVSNYELKIEEEQTALAKLEFQIKTLIGE